MGSKQIPAQFSDPDVDGDSDNSIDGTTGDSVLPVAFDAGISVGASETADTDWCEGDPVIRLVGGLDTG
jgi:hypothetical protein